MHTGKSFWKLNSTHANRQSPENPTRNHYYNKQCKSQYDCLDSIRHFTQPRTRHLSEGSASLSGTWSRSCWAWSASRCLTPRRRTPTPATPPPPPRPPPPPHPHWWRRARRRRRQRAGRRRPPTDADAKAHPWPHLRMHHATPSPVGRSIGPFSPAQCSFPVFIEEMCLPVPLRGRFGPLSFMTTQGPHMEQNQVHCFGVGLYGIPQTPMGDGWDPAALPFPLLPWCGVFLRPPL